MEVTAVDVDCVLHWKKLRQLAELADKIKVIFKENSAVFVTYSVEGHRFSRRKLQILSIINNV